MRLFCALILVATALPAQDQAPPMAMIEGRVIDSVSGDPIRKANVTLILNSGGMNRVMASLASGASYTPNRSQRLPETALVTDANGNFRATVTPGTYQARAERNGYVNLPGTLTSVTVAAGETAKAVAIKLHKHGVITGRVLDEDGEPLARVNVQQLKWIQQNGRRTLIPQGSTSTNDLGEFRIFGIAPGRYLVSAQANVGGFGSLGRSRQTYATIFFPGVADPSAAQAVEIAPGATRQGIDLRLQKVAVVTISGKVGGVAPGTTPERRMGAMVMLVPRHSPLMMGGMMQHAVPVSPQGDFEMPNVPAGSYILTAQTQGPNQDRRSARLNIEVGDRDLAGLSLSLEAGLTLNAQIRAEDAPSLAGLMLYLQGSGPMSNSTGRADAEGKIALANLDKDLYRASVNGLPAGYYVKSMQLGSFDAKDSLDLTAGAAGELIIMLEKGTAEISGQVVGKDQKPAIAAQVIVLNARHETVRIGQTDAQGHYRIRELPPGDYRLATTADPDLSDPDTLDRLATTAEKITLARSAKETRQLELR